MKINPEEYEELETFVKIKPKKKTDINRPFRIVMCNKAEIEWILHSSYNHKNERDKAFHNLVMGRHSPTSVYYKKVDV